MIYRTDQVYHCYGHPLRKEMIRKGLTVDKLAEMVGVNRSTILNILKRRTICPSDYTLDGICEVFGWDMEKAVKICGR